MMGTDYNNMVYQSGGAQIPMETASQQEQGMGGVLMSEHGVKIGTNEYEMGQVYSQDGHLQPQDVILIQNHQAQLQQQQMETTNYGNNGETVAETTIEATTTEKNVSVPVTEEAVEGQNETKDAEDEGSVPENATETTEKAEGEESQEPVEGVSEPPKPKEPKIDPEQCRACTSKENLQNIFDFKGDQVIANLIKIICPHLNISERDALPNKICASCVEKVSAAYEFKKVAEQTDKDFRAHLKRSQNKRRNAGDYILLDAKVALLSSSDDDEDAMMQDDDEFKVSKSEESSESEDSVDSDFKPKKKYYKKKTPSKKKKKAPTPKPTKSSKKKKETASATGKGFKSNVVYIEAASNDDESDSDTAPPKKKKKPTGVAAERPAGGLPCPQCDRVLANSHGLREHLKSHSTEKFTCKLCNKQFKLKLSLDAHMARHREEKERAENAAKAKVKIVKVPVQAVKKTTPSKPVSSASKKDSSKKREGEPATGKDLFKTCAPLTSTYWSDSFSD